MRRVAILLTLAAMLFSFPITGAAQSTGQTGEQRTGSSRFGVATTTSNTIGGQTTGDRQAARAELERLRQDLQRLQRTLREKETDLRKARKDHNREAGDRLTTEIKQIKQEIERIQRRIHDLSRGR